MNEFKDELIVQYLLGGSSADVELCENDARTIETQYLTDPQFFEHILAIEDDLIQSYANGELSPEDRSRFEQRYLDNPKIMARVQFFQKLNNWAVKDKRP
jgi:hypothetical protein